MKANKTLSILSGAAMLLLAASTQAAVIWTNPITGANPGQSNPYTTGQTVASNLTVSGIGHGAGVAGVNANDRYNANSWNTASLDPTAYFNWTLTPQSGFTLSLSSFVYTSQVSSSVSNPPVSNFAFSSSLDNFTSTIGTPTATGATIDLSGASFQNLSGPIEFRLYGWGASTGSSSTFSINDFSFNGAVVPEPSTVIGGALAMAGLGWHQRRRVKGLLHARAA